MDQSMDQKQMQSLLDSCYERALSGIPKVSESTSRLSSEYLKKYKTKESASKKLIKNQIVKCGTSGFVTGLGGLITLPVAIPANVASVIYVQMRMIAAIAEIGGWETDSDEVRTIVYVCLTGTAATDILKQTGIKIGEKLTLNLIKKIPGSVLTKINQKVGFRLVTKLGTKGIINLGKAIPVVGGVIGGGIDIAATKVIAQNAYDIFIEGKMP